MPFQVSPGVNVSEIDLTTVVPAVSTTEGAIAGVFRWGPVEQRVLVDSESNLVARFGKPTNYNAETFFTAANFLSYGNKLYVVRSANTTDLTNGALTAVGTTGTLTSPLQYVIKNEDDYNSKTFSESDVQYAAKYPGELGNSLRVSVVDSAAGYSSNVSIVANASISGTSAFTITVGSNTGTLTVSNTASGTLNDANTVANTVASALTVGDYIEVGNNTIGKQYLKITSIGSITQGASNRTVSIGFEDVYQLSSDYSANTISRKWEYFNVVDTAPSQSEYNLSFGNTAAVDELHVVVVDQGGKFTGTPGTVLEVFAGLSRATNAKTADGSGNYYKDVINLNSSYVWWTYDRPGALSNTAVNIINSTNSKPMTLNFVGGQDGLAEDAVAISDIARGYDLFKSAEDVAISLVLQGKARGGSNEAQVGNYIIDNIAEGRKDCVAFLSPARSDVVANVGGEADAIIAFRNSSRSSSYAVLDSGYKYQYDKYNDLYRWVPLNGDTAGLCVRTDELRDPWFSPAGFNRGQIKNIVKLAYNPGKADRDVLYKAGVNPVVTFPGQGTILYGDKTLLAKPSAFDRINVRRLFIVLEKAISTAAKFTMFEFNDDFTRAQFRNLVEPFLRDVQGRRGIYDYRVVCDATNNTGEVIDRNEFVGDIYIKPAKSINYIQLNFVAVRSGVEFSEIVGQF